MSLRRRENAAELCVTIPAGAEEITPEWLTLALGTRTLGAARVTTARLTRIGANEAFTGGSLHHIALTLDRLTPGAPTSLVAKQSPKDPVMRATMAQANARESDFYSGLALGNGLPVPLCHYADHYALTGASILLLQDLTAARRVDFTAGCDTADARQVVEALATLHAARWNDPSLAEVAGPAMLPDFPFATAWKDYPSRLQGTLPGVSLPAAFLGLGDHIAGHEAQIVARYLASGPLTFLHRDPQIDNVVFAPGGALLLDWQFCGTGRGVQDVAYFLISSLPPATRRTEEAGLLAHYHGRLLQAGVAGYTLADLRADYRRAVLGKMLLTVAATAYLDNGGLAKARWRQTDLQRLLAFCADHEVTASLFPTG